RLARVRREGALPVPTFARAGLGSAPREPVVRRGAVPSEASIEAREVGKLPLRVDRIAVEDAIAPEVPGLVGEGEDRVVPQEPSRPGLLIEDDARERAVIGPALKAEIVELEARALLGVGERPEPVRPRGAGQ